jgi:hypothetical protein
MVELLKPHRELLCFFAQAAGYAHCVLGLDFDGYDARDTTVPVIVMSGAEARPLLKVHGRRFQRAFEASGPGKGLLVTFTSAAATGWFELEWKLEAARVFTYSGG